MTKQKTETKKVKENGPKKTKPIDKRERLRAKRDERAKKKEEAKAIQNLNDLDHKQLFRIVTSLVDKLRAEKNQVDSHAQAIDVALQGNIRSVESHAQEQQAINKRIGGIEETLDEILDILLEKEEPEEEDLDKNVEK